MPGSRIAHGLTIVLRRNLLSLPMRASGLAIVDLEAVHAQVSFSRLWVPRGDARERDEASGVLRPALQDGEVEQRKVVAFDDFFAGAGGNCFWEKLSGFGEEWKHF